MISRVSDRLTTSRIGRALSQQVGNRLSRLGEGRLAGNLAWMATSQLGNRLLRILATVVVARMLGPEVYGLAALVLAINEMVHVLSHGGISGKLVQADDDELPRLRTSGYWLNWWLCGALTVVQVLAAFPMAAFYGNADLIAPIICLAFSYLVLPSATIQAALLMRDNRLGAIARVDMAQSIADTGLTLLLALSGAGLWALVLPKLLVVPVWAWLIRRQHPWRIQGRPTLAGWREILRFGKHLVWIDLLTALRNNIDYLIVGRLLGVEALGVYYFAFNAGLGLAQGLIRAATASLYPHLCELRDDLVAMRARLRRSLGLILACMVPIVLLQASLAPWYVPWVFGQKWAALGAIPILMLLSLSALPRLVSEAMSQWLRAGNRPELDTRAQTLFTLGYGLALAGATQLGLSQDGLIEVAAAVSLSQLLFAVALTGWCLRRMSSNGHGGNAMPASPSTACLPSALEQ
ncbi:oligosaccharide flippase family protein [Onishia taeanensis]